MDAVLSFPFEKLNWAGSSSTCFAAPSRLASKELSKTNSGMGGTLEPSSINRAELVIWVSGEPISESVVLKGKAILEGNEVPLWMLGEWAVEYSI